MNFSIPILELESSCETLGGRNKKTSYEYELIASLVLQQYQREGAVLFERLLMIPLSQRIPALLVEYGGTRMYRVVLSMLLNFSRYSLGESYKMSKPELNESVSVLLSASGKHELSLEDLVLFFERAKSGYYGTIQEAYTAAIVSKQFSQYLNEREDAMIELARQKTIELKALGNERIEAEPIRIGDLLNGATVVKMNKKMSG